MILILLSEAKLRSNLHQYQPGIVYKMLDTFFLNAMIINNIRGISETP